MGRRIRLARILWALLAVAALLLVLKTFVADVYPVTSGSMRPTIFGGASSPGGEPFTEYVLVRFEKGMTPDRYDLVVIRPKGGGDPLVKRVHGLPWESVQVSGGDVLIEGKRLSPDDGRPAPIPLFDDRYQKVEDYFRVQQTSERWVREGSEWRMDATAVPPGHDGAMLHYNKILDDGYLDENHQRVKGGRPVNDTAIECEVFLEKAEGRLRLQLAEELDTFHAILQPAEDETAGYRLLVTRTNRDMQAQPDPDAKFETLGDAPIPFGPGEWHRVRFSNIDNHLVFDLDQGTYHLVVDYDDNDLHGKPAPSIRHLASRALGGEGCRARFRGIRVLRDLYYTRVSELGAPDPETGPPEAPPPRMTLGPNQYFVLGDNSSESHDSRSFGPIEADDILGRPVAVVWPLARRRWL